MKDLKNSLLINMLPAPWALPVTLLGLIIIYSKYSTKAQKKTKLELEKAAEDVKDEIREKNLYKELEKAKIESLLTNKEKAEINNVIKTIEPSITENKTIKKKVILELDNLKNHENKNI